MKASYKPPIPEEPKVVLEMTKYEAQVLRKITSYNISIPDMLVSQFKPEFTSITHEALCRVIDDVNCALDALMTSYTERL